MTERISVKQGGNYEKHFVLDTSRFSPGVYRVRMVAFEPNIYGGQVRFDCIDNAFMFEVYNFHEENNMEWESNWWGNYVLPKAVDCYEE